MRAATARAEAVGGGQVGGVAGGVRRTAVEPSERRDVRRDAVRAARLARVAHEANVQPAAAIVVESRQAHLNLPRRHRRPARAAVRVAAATAAAAAAVGVVGVLDGGGAAAAGVAVGDLRGAKVLDGKVSGGARVGGGCRGKGPE